MDKIQTPHRVVEYEDGYLWFYCRGCETHHRVKLGTWHYNGDPVKPTLTPSVMVTYEPVKKCHFFVTDGRIMYLTDTFHMFRGQTIDLPFLDDELSPKYVA